MHYAELILPGSFSYQLQGRALAVRFCGVQIVAAYFCRLFIACPWLKRGALSTPVVWKVKNGGWRTKFITVFCFHSGQIYTN